ncbi:hypothetical protein Tco_1135108 [Tanacetum coccineum]
MCIEVSGTDYCIIDLPSSFEDKGDDGSNFRERDMVIVVSFRCLIGEGFFSYKWTNKDGFEDVTSMKGAILEDVDVTV